MSSLDPRFEARYGEATSLPVPPAADGPAHAMLDRMLDHRSVRQFLDTPLPAGTLETLVAAAQSAPTSSNLQTWSVVAVTDAERKKKLAQWCNNQAHVAKVPLFLVWVADLSRIDRVAARRGFEAGASRFMEMFLVASIDAALAAQNAVVAAESLGLGTLYVGALRNRPLDVAAELGLPQRAFGVFGMCIGYPDPAVPTGVKPRLPQQVVLHRERYTVRDDEPAEVAGYDERIQAFQRSQSMAQMPWSQQASTRLRGPETLSGRHQLVSWLRERGFGLE